jgi:hypothetical protein
VGAQPESRMQNLCCSEHSNRRTHYRSTKGPRVEAPESGMCDVQQTPPFRAPIDISRISTGELHSVTIQLAISDEAVALRPGPRSGGAAPGSNKKAPSNISVYGIEEGAKSVKKWHKQRLQGVTATTDSDGGNNEMAISPRAVSDAIATSGSKRQTRLPADHFERILREACPNHMYPIKAQAQGLRHDEELHDLGVPQLRHGS